MKQNTTSPKSQLQRVSFTCKSKCLRCQVILTNLSPYFTAAAAAIKEKMRAFNARPIKKVREAKGRKKMKAAQRLEKLKKKSDLLVNEEGMTEKEKAESIAKLLRKATKKKPKQAVKVVVAKGANRGIKGRPQGIKGRYKIVDPRMKKEMRALKRVAQKAKKRR